MEADALFSISFSNVLTFSFYFASSCNIFQ